MLKLQFHQCMKMTHGEPGGLSEHFEPMTGLQCFVEWHAEPRDERGSLNNRREVWLVNASQPCLISSNPEERGRHMYLLHDLNLPHGGLPVVLIISCRLKSW